MAKGKIADLTRYLDSLAESTWQKLAYGPGRNIPFREDGITSENLFALDTRHPWLHVWGFTQKQESKNGADWEWWIGSSQQGWICLRFQAKRHNIGRHYRELDHRVGENEIPQINLLIESAAADSTTWDVPVIPLYCFYNGWIDNPGVSPDPSDADWPAGVQCISCPNGYSPHACEHVNLRDYGCTIVSAYTVQYLKKLHGRPYSVKNFLEHSIPWSHLFRADFSSTKAGIGAQAGENYRASEVAVGVLKRTQSMWRDLVESEQISRDLEFDPREILDSRSMWSPGPQPAPYVDTLLQSGLDSLIDNRQPLPDVARLAVLSVPRIVRKGTASKTATNQ
jgi:hypothetical protein